MKGEDPGLEDGGGPGSHSTGDMLGEIFNMQGESHKIHKHTDKRINTVFQCKHVCSFSLYNVQLNLSILCVYSSSQMYTNSVKRPFVQ